LAGHDHALDLVGAFVDLGDLGVAHHAFHGEVRGIAVSASNWTASMVMSIAVSEARYTAATPLVQLAAMLWLPSRFDACRRDSRDYASCSPLGQFQRRCLPTAGTTCTAQW
jgi:hypothetical protein